jgi:tetratricopeptide (TPR) repeat protein
MSAHLERARLLLAQSRPADAERETLFALGQQPDDPYALGLLALARLEQGRNPAALEAAREAVGRAPDEAFFHSVHAHVLRELERPDDAFRAVQEALRLEPADAEHFALLASIELQRQRWSAALEAAERALALNAEHVGAANLRAIALVRLGRKAEAMEAVDFALERAPDDAFSHANQGWNCLHRNDPRRAQEHFREALRLNPDLEYAQQGMLEALKARNPVYRAMLVFFLWQARQTARFQWAFIIGLFFAGNAARSLSQAQPQLNWLWWPLLGLFYAFVYLSWTAIPMFNLLLCFDRFGRHVLSPDQRRGARWFGGTFVLALGALAWWLGRDSETAFFATVVLAVLSICIAATFARTGRTRRILAACTAGLAFVAITASLLLQREQSAGMTLMTVFTVGFIGFQILANVLATR